MNKFRLLCKTEFYNKIWQNKWQIIKFSIICFVPFLYGFICCWAFWNPLDNIKNIPIAIVDHSQTTCISYLVKKDASSSKNNSLVNSSKAIFRNISPGQTCQTIADNWYKSLPSYETDGYSEEHYQDSLIQDVLNSNKDYNSQTQTLTISQDGMVIKINNLVGKKVNFKPDDKYWAQLQINSQFTNNMFKLLYDLKNNNNKIITNLQNIMQNLPKLWTTYKQNFLAGQVLYTFTQIKTALVHQTLPLLIAPSLFYLLAHQDTNKNEYLINSSDVSNYISSCIDLLNPNKIIGNYILSLIDRKENPELYQIVKTILTEFSNYTEDNINAFILHNLFNDYDGNVDYNTYNNSIQNLINGYLNIGNFFNIPTAIEGYQYGQYGVGLGEFFIAIALWVGILMQTFIFDRDCRTKTGRWYHHYFSKLLLMMFTTTIQVVILALSLCALGFWTLGPPFLLLFVWLLAVGLIFTVIEHAIWFIPDDGDVGKFLVVIYLIINLAAGWGTFPSFMQGSFFNTISFIAPFRYLIHGMGTIIYGISVNSSSLANYQQTMLTNFGILLIWVPIFLILGLLFTYLWRRGELFGTIKRKLIIKSLFGKQNAIRTALLSELLNDVIYCSK